MPRSLDKSLPTRASFLPRLDNKSSLRIPSRYSSIACLFEGLLAIELAEFRTMSRLRSDVPKFGSHAVAGEYLLAAPAEPGSVLLQTLLDCAIIA